MELHVDEATSHPHLHDVWISTLILEHCILCWPDPWSFLRVKITLEDIKYLPLLLIVNTHAVNLPGEHWKAIYISHERKGEVFDSLATVISIPLLQWLNTFTNKWTHSRLTIQHPASPSCGAFVLYFILNRLNVKNMKDIVDCFSNNLADNDIMMRAYVKSLK